MKDLVARLESIQMYGDEESEEPKGEMVNYALCTSISNSDFIVIESSYYEEACTNSIWLQPMKEEIDAIERNDTWELCESHK